MDTPEDSDLLFGRLVVEQKLVRPEHVRECLGVQAALAAQGASPLPRLGELLVQRGYLTPAQFGQTMGASGAAPSSSPPSDTPEGERFGKYVKTRRLGEGGMGEVWKAWDGGLRRWVALKLLKNDDASDIARFKREAQTAGALNHPNIAAVYEVGEVAGKHFIAMQFVEGQTLCDYPRRDRRRLVGFIRDAALAVHAAHRQGILHRDLKPDNLMVGEPGRRVYVMDFGLAKSMDLHSPLSVSGAVVGTPDYMSPEQARGLVHRLDARCDVYSLGATLYELPANRKPFDESDVFELLRKVVDVDPEPVRRVEPKIDRDLETVVMKCMEKDPARRYATALELAKDLTRYIDGRPILAHPPSVTYRVSKFLARRKGIVAAGAVACAGLLFAAGYWLALRRQAQGWAREGEAKARAGEYEEAKRLFDRASARIAVNEDLYRQCEAKLSERRAQAEAKRREDAILGPLRARLAQLPESPDGWSRGLRLLEQALREFDGSSETWMLKGTLHQRLFEWDDALESYRRALALNPRLGAAHYRRGMILLEAKERRDEALVEFERAQEVEPDNEYAMAGRARVANLRGDPAGALKLCDEAERGGDGPPISTSFGGGRTGTRPAGSSIRTARSPVTRRCSISRRTFGRPGTIAARSVTERRNVSSPRDGPGRRPPSGTPRCRITRRS